MRRRKVLVKRLVCIEDLGDVDMLFTDKTGTLTQGRIAYMRAVPAGDGGPDLVLRWGLLCTENTIPDEQAVGGSPLDQALWQSRAAAGERAALAGYTRLAVLPFDHVVRAGSRIRLIIDTPSQTGGWNFEPLANAGVNSILHDSKHPSSIAVGTVPGARAGAGYPACDTLLNQPCRPNAFTASAAPAS